MTPALPPGTVLAAFNAALMRLEAERLRMDEDLVGLPLPEPLLGDMPGLVVSVFPVAGAGPGTPGRVYPARALMRVSLGAGQAVQIVHPVSLADMPADQPLGEPVRATALPVAENRRTRQHFIALLDQAAPQVARKDNSDPGLKAEILAAWNALRMPVLDHSYRLFAPRFHTWLAL